MVCPCCVSAPPCEPCEECEFPSSQLEFSGEPLECFGQNSSPSFRSQDIYNGTPPGGLPTGVSWKSGYPAALSGCSWAFVIDSLSIDCCYEACIVNGQETNLFSAKTRNRYRVLLLTCLDGPESATITDISSDALDGVLEPTSEGNPENCPDPPVACTEWLDYYPDPAPVCNEFP
jgi:hypothetical protein